MGFTKVAIVGGTHGNESTGVFLVKKLKEQLPEYRGINLDYYIGNPKAVRECRRFIDSDLNRAFMTRELSDSSLYGYESNRAKVINQCIGPKGNSSYDFIIDMHTSTTNMGTTIILCELNEFTTQFSAYMAARLDDVYIYYIPSKAYMGSDDHAFLNSIHSKSLALEVGPIPNGIVREDITAKTEAAVMTTLDFLMEKNSGSSLEFPERIEIFEHLAKVDFPLDDAGELSACVHGDLQDRDYEPLKKGDPIFRGIDNTALCYDGKHGETVYPVFINEAAYYNTNTAFSITKKTSVKVGK